MTSSPPPGVPATTRAVVIRGKGDVGIDDAVPTPRLREGYVLVRTTAVALNPTDWKHVDFAMGGDPTGARVGCDYAGIVKAVGPGVTTFKPGDRIAGGVHGANQSQHEDGAFAEYIAAKADIAFKIPDTMTDTDASTLGLGVTTVAQGLFQELKLNLPSDPVTTGEPILISGGATATGILGIQFAKQAGYRVLATASPKQFAYLQSLGVDAGDLADYHAGAQACAETLAAAAREHRNPGHVPLTKAWDCVASPETTELCARTLAATTGAASLHYRSLLPVADDVVRRVDARIDNGYSYYYKAFGEAFTKAVPFAASPADHAFACDFWRLAAELITAARIVPAPAFVDQGGAGLEGVLAGLQTLKAGDVHGGKLVYTMV
ncbi:zinc-binding oxidoreductase [Niveomyces insectorum RCEF 264]|uniref:Zinc-binding oxidoreductase n=1 Tax=Niveomyces insectorum RCEF 264 TaxID=1081102 RepID=A0A167NI34_9HYPO|nr:zinc-binding oxidoreductase [Niveomyces insectorum RCEF 264]